MKTEIAATADIAEYRRFRQQSRQLAVITEIEAVTNICGNTEITEITGRKGGESHEPPAASVPA